MKNFFNNHSLICPACFSKLNHSNQLFICPKCEESYPQINNKIILVKKDHDLFSKEEYNSQIDKRNTFDLSKIKKLIPDISINLTQNNSLLKFHRIVNQKKDYNILVLGSGNQKKELLRVFTNEDQIIFSDISIKSDCDIIFDCHNIPFENRTFDGVIITAVLEHVYYPEEVVKDIHRVLKDKGIVYSEIPFMQQIHEGAYDFTRFSMVGHNKLFNNFKLIDFGMVAGPGTSLAWSIENFFVAFFYSNLLRDISKLFSRLLFFWLKYFDYLFQFNKKAIDGASCTFVLAEKQNMYTSKKDIINTYNN